MAKKKIVKPRKEYVPERELKFTVTTKTKTTARKTPTEIFWELKGGVKISDLAKLTGKSERTVRSYYKYLSGQEMGANDRKPPEDFLKNIKKVSRRVTLSPKRKESIIKPGSKVIQTKETLLTVTRFSHVKQSNLITKEAKKGFEARLKKLGKKYSYTLVKFGIRYYRKSGETFDKYQAISTQFVHVTDILQQVQEYLNSLLMPYIIKAEIFSLQFEIIGRKNKIIGNDKK